MVSILNTERSFPARPIIICTQSIRITDTFDQPINNKRKNITSFIK